MQKTKIKGNIYFKLNKLMFHTLFGNNSYAVKLDGLSANKHFTSGQLIIIYIRVSTPLNLFSDFQNQTKFDSVLCSVLIEKLCVVILCYQILFD